MHEMLTPTCEDWREISEDNLAETEVIVEMMIEAGEDLCSDAEDDVQDVAA